MITEIYPTSHFVRAYKKLSEKIRKCVKKKEKIFIINPFDIRLKTHRPKGKFKNYWSYSVGYKHRIMFRFIDKKTVLYHDIGTHKIYR